MYKTRSQNIQRARDSKGGNRKSAFVEGISLNRKERRDFLKRTLSSANIRKLGGWPVEKLELLDASIVL